MFPHDTPAQIDSEFGSENGISMLDRLSEATPRLRAAHERVVAGIKKAADRVGLTLLLMAAGTLLLRPADLFPALEGLPIYETLMAACIFVSLPRTLPLVGRSPLMRTGAVALTLLFIPAVLLSHLSHLKFFEARVGGVAMLKACTLFLLMIAIVDSPRKLRATLVTLVAAVLGVSALALMQYHGLLHLASLQTIADRPLNSGDAEPILRLCGVGVFNDPNDFSLVLVTAGFVCIYGLTERPVTLARLALVVPLALFGYALYLTHSRGGLLSALSGLMAFLVARYGWRNALPMACAMIPVVLVVFWGRQTAINLSDPEDTFQARLGLWSESFDQFRSAPLFGIGQGRLADEIGQVTHNSFLHAFAELGLFGGCVFIGAFYIVLRGVWRASAHDRELERLRPYVMAMTFGYAAGLLSLSRCYTVPTQLMLALATVYTLLAVPGGVRAMPRLDWRMVQRIAGVGTAFLVVAYGFVRVMLNR